VDRRNLAAKRLVIAKDVKDGSFEFRVGYAA
jgi:hypothetical protein